MIIPLQTLGDLFILAFAWTNVPSIIFTSPDANWRRIQMIGEFLRQRFTADARGTDHAIVRDRSGDLELKNVAVGFRGCVVDHTHEVRGSSPCAPTP